MKSQITTVILVLIAVGIMMDISLSSNLVSRSYLYIMLLYLSVGVFAPRASVYLSIFTTAFLDFFKRLMVVSGNPSQTDLYFILACPLVAVGGAFLSQAFSYLSSGDIVAARDDKAKRWQGIMVIASLTLITLVGLSAVAGGTGLKAIYQSINLVYYSLLLFIVPRLFTTIQDYVRILKVFFGCFVISALYMLKHHFFGLADFEYAYLYTGLSIESRILWENDGALRVFSTLSSASVASIMYSLCAVITVPLFLLKNGRIHLPMIPVVLGLIALFVLAAYASISRGGWFCGIGAAVAYFFLRNKFRIIVGAVLACIMFVGVVVTAPRMHQSKEMVHLEDWMTERISQDNASLNRAVVLGTFNDRFKGYASWTQRLEIWKPFGLMFDDMSMEQKDLVAFNFGHDVLTDSLVKYGFIPVFIIVGLGGFAFVKSVKVYSTLNKNSAGYRIVRLCMAMSLGIMVGGLSNDSQFSVYPVNVCLFVFVAGIVIVLISKAEHESRPADLNPIST